MTENQKNAVTCFGTLGVLLVGLCGYFVFLAKLHKDSKEMDQKIERNSRETKERICQEVTKYFNGESANK